MKTMARKHLSERLPSLDFQLECSILFLVEKKDIFSCIALRVLLLTCMSGKSGRRGKYHSKRLTKCAKKAARKI